MTPDDEQFQKFLAWLDPDPERAGLKYETIRRRLIKIFTNRGSHIPEDLADETITRVAQTVKTETYQGDPAPYFYGVAKKIFSEHIRKANRRWPDPRPMASHGHSEPQLKCLDECLETLDPESRELILNYFRGKKQAKIKSRKQMGEDLGIKAGALRARIFRLRAKLAKCVKECMERTGESNDIN